MKRIVALVLVILALLPAESFAANPVGVTVDDFVARLVEDVPGFVILTNGYKNRTVFYGQEKSGAIIVGATFQKSNIIEVTYVKSPLMSELTAYFLLSMIESPSKLADMAFVEEIMRTITHTQILSYPSAITAKKWVKEKSSLIGSYYPELYRDQNDNAICILINESSKIKNKDAVLSMIPDKALPITEVTERLAAEN